MYFICWIRTVDEDDVKDSLFVGDKQWADKLVASIKALPDATWFKVVKGDNIMVGLRLPTRWNVIVGKTS